jgi:hypothetical protein
MFGAMASGALAPFALILATSAVGLSGRRTSPEETTAMLDRLTYYV